MATGDGLEGTKPAVSEEAAGAIRPDPKLVAEGWRQRNVSGPDRVEELSELYESLGHEVRIETLSPSSFGSACEGCAVVACTSYVVIYTRKRE